MFGIFEIWLNWLILFLLFILSLWFFLLFALFLFYLLFGWSFLGWFFLGLPLLPLNIAPIHTIGLWNLSGHLRSSKLNLLKGVIIFVFDLVVKLIVSIRFFEVMRILFHNLGCHVHLAQCRLTYHLLCKNFLHNNNTQNSTNT